MMFETDSSIDELTGQSVNRVRELMNESDSTRKFEEKTSRRRVARLFKDEKAIQATITLTDEVMRIQSSGASARIFRRAANKASVLGFGLINAVGLKSLGIFSRVFPSLSVAIVHKTIRTLSKSQILPYEKAALQRHLHKRQNAGLSLNINVLGEAVLGNHEAAARLDLILDAIRRPEVNYISVKLSAVVAQIITIDFDNSVRRVSEKMRVLYREAIANNTFINLDMEEYRDLPMTVAAFKTTLSESEFSKMNAGIVIQAYLPESHVFFAELVDFSVKRYAEHGSHIKIRLVKGANLAMENAEAEIHGWTSAPYKSKSDVDASYARLIDSALRPEHAKAVRIGIASHNLFHLTWAIEVARNRGVLDQLDIEMLEGMANSEAAALTRSGHPVLLYAPVTQQSDFAAAVAYLVRRLDENTSDENYLKATFEISNNPAKYDEQRDRFLKSVAERHTIFTGSYRHAQKPMPQSDFSNQREEDPTNPEFVLAMKNAITNVQNETALDIPIVIAGRELSSSEKEAGFDPSDNGKPWYSYSVGGINDVDSAIVTAAQAQASWANLSIEERKQILYRVADVMHAQTEKTISVMTKDAGKTVAEADPEISEAIDFARFYASSARNFEGSTPLGTVLVVPPWNFPYAIPAGGVFAALAAGNTVILKPAPETVATAWILANQIWQGGVPKEVLQFLPMRDDDSGKYLVSHPAINGVILTGAFETATLFASWNPEINLMAETSGKNAMLISACADIDIAVKDLVQSAFGHAGQKCSAASVAIVDSTIYNNPSFINQLTDAVNSLSVGAGWDFSTTVGPVIRKPEGNLLRAFSKLEEGEHWLVEPKQIDDAGMLWRPGVKVGVKAGSWSHRNEWFGPVLAIIEAPDFETAIEWQNQTDFGLTAGIQSLDENECAIWISRMQAGNLYVNRGTTGAIVNRQPFGGWKKSSVGPNAKAGGLNYVNILRDWAKVTEVESSFYGARNWWEKIGSQSIDRTGLTVEKNFQRYARHRNPILVVTDETTSRDEMILVQRITDLMKVKVEFVSSIESSDGDFARVRWLAASKPPVQELLAKGITVDHRPIAQRGDIEAPRWLLEQSVAITYHRYGNVNGGPKPACPGLASMD